jgi:nucleotide-binding universal stress UspA family protein
MTIANILVHVDGSERAKLRIAIASELSTRHDAHLIGLAASGAIPIPGHAQVPFAGAFMGTVTDSMRDSANQAVAVFRTYTDREQLRPAESRVVPSAVETALLEHGRYSDLIVVGQPSREAFDFRTLNMPGLVYLLMGVARPVLVIPYAGQCKTPGNRVLIAWNDSPQSMRAVTDSLPLLRQAEQVDLLVFNSRRTPWGDDEEPGAEIALYLARHAVKVSVHSEKVDIDVGNAIISRAADFGSDLIVTGAYGHSYLRELILGGVTQKLLDTMTVPVLMSH